MSKARASYYMRFGDLIVSATCADTFGPDSLDELRLQVERGFATGITYTGLGEYEEEAPAVIDPGTVDTTDLPPI